MLPFVQFGSVIIPAMSEVAISMISQYSLPIGLQATAADFPWAKTARATFTLLRLAKKCVFVTCHHVLSEFWNLQKVDSSAEMVAYLTSGSTFCELNGFRIIADDDRVDVAIFGGLEDIVEILGHDFIDYESCYLHDPAPGEPVSIVGYPSGNVTVTQKLADFGYMHLGLRASSVSDRQITLANEHGDRHFIDFAIHRRGKIDLGGLSGSPAFVIRNHEYRFVGIVSECHERDRTIIISRLGCINPDGTLDYTRIPW